MSFGDLLGFVVYSSARSAPRPVRDRSRVSLSSALWFVIVLFGLVALIGFETHF